MSFSINSSWQDIEPDEKVCNFIKEYTQGGYNFSCKLAPHPRNRNAQLLVHIKLSNIGRGGVSASQLGYLTGSLIKYKGGSIHIDTIEVHPMFRGRDLGLLMISKALKFLWGGWRLAVMKPNFINDSCLKWNINTKNPSTPKKLTRLSEKEVQLQAKEYRSSKIKLLRYFGRIGFTQAQKTTNGYDKLFLTSEMYCTSSGIVKPWVKKEDALEQVKVFVPSSLPLQTITNTAKARRGKNVIDDVDGDGNRALHLAAEQFKAAEVKRLLAVGAKLDAKNKKGNTALDVAVLKLRSLNDRSLTNRHQKRVPLEIDVVPPYETISALMDKDVKQKMSDGWLSPRMRKMLSITAELEGDEIREEILRYIPADDSGISIGQYGRYHACMKVYIK